MPTKRLFFGMEVRSPWPEKFPGGRLLDPEHRHLTLAFLGNTDYEQMEQALLAFPQPPFKVGFAATFDQCLFLPPRHPHVVAWHLKWWDDQAPLVNFQATLIQWLQEKGFTPDVRHGFTPHVTVCRGPFPVNAWRKKFTPLPVIAHGIHLYESIGHSKYASLWHYPLLVPFEEIDHTADIAFLVRASNYHQLFYNAATALAFHFPPLLAYLPPIGTWEGLEEIIISLNHIVGQADRDLGCPFKAVSFHNRTTVQDNVIHWEMIVDV